MSVRGSCIRFTLLLALQFHVEVAGRVTNALPRVRDHEQLLHELLRLRLLLHFDHFEDAVREGL